METKFALRLEELHGEQPESKPSVMSLELMNLNLKHNDKVLQRALPKSMAVRSLIGIISRLFSLDARKVWQFFFPSTVFDP